MLINVCRIPAATQSLFLARGCGSHISSCVKLLTCGARPTLRRFFNEFLMTHERHVAKEIRDEYVDTMSKIYYSYFKSYISRLTKLQVHRHSSKLPLSFSFFLLFGQHLIIG